MIPEPANMTLWDASNFFWRLFDLPHPDVHWPEPESFLGTFFFATSSLSNAGAEIPAIFQLVQQFWIHQLHHGPALLNPVINSASWQAATILPFRISMSGIWYGGQPWYSGLAMSRWYMLHLKTVKIRLTIVLTRMAASVDVQIRVTNSSWFLSYLMVVLATTLALCSRLAVKSFFSFSAMNSDKEAANLELWVSVWRELSLLKENW